MADVKGPRPVLLFGAVCMVAGLVATANAQRLWVGVLTYGLGVGLGCGLYVSPLTALVGRLFAQRRTTALSVAAAGHGLGTLIYANEYEHIRPAKKKDLRAIHLLTKQGADAEELVKRSKATIEKSLGDYFIFEIDKNPVACVALHVYPEQNQGELASLYVSSSHENQGIGRKLIQFVENKARELGVREVLALSTQAFTYFQSKAGFVEGTPDDLPPARREKYEQSGRNSKVLVKKLK